MLDETKNLTIYTCECGGDALGVTYDPQGPDSLPIVYVSTWSVGRDNRYPWRVRIRLAWKILTHGYGYLDTFCFSPATALELADALIHAVRSVANAPVSKSKIDNVGGTNGVPSNKIQ